jgi:hypothetical protein
MPMVRRIANEDGLRAFDSHMRTASALLHRNGWGLESEPDGARSERRLDCEPSGSLLCFHTSGRRRATPPESRGHSSDSAKQFAFFLGARRPKARGAADARRRHSHANALFR